jgi:predicted MFS family arabinose efflux permease
MSFSHSGVSLGGIVLVPWATGLIATDGVAAAGTALAAVLLLVALPVTVFVLRFDPADHGLAPDGPGAAARRSVAANPLLDQAVQSRLWSSREALATRSFWLLAVAVGLILFCQQSVLVHEISLLRERTGDPRDGALAVSATAAASVTARLIVGVFGDRVAKKRLAAGLMLIQGVALLGFSVAPGLPALYAAAVVFGLTIGNVYMLQSLLVGELYGFASFGVVLGLLNLITQVAGGLGPFLLGAMHGALGGYEQPLRLLAVLAFVAAGVVSRVHPPPRA